MFRKLLVTLSIALVAALAVGGVAYASTQTPAQTASIQSTLSAIDSNTAVSPNAASLALSAAECLRSGLGQVTALGTSQFTVKFQDGSQEVIGVDANTRYIKPDGSAGAFASLQMNGWVIVHTTLSADAPIARLVVVLPAAFNPAIKDQVVRGTVTAISASSITLSGRSQPVSVDSSTIYAGEIHSLSDLKAGMKVIIGAQRQSDGSLLAVVVGVSGVIVRHDGTIASVDAAANTITLTTLKDKSLVIKVDSNTEYFGQVTGLASLKAGLKISVAAREQPDRSLLALRIASGPKAQADVEVIGQVTALTTTSFTILGRDGKSYTFQLGQTTCFRGLRGQVKTLDDLHLGMTVAVAARNMGVGNLQALVVEARKK